MGAGTNWKRSLAPDRRNSTTRATTAAAREIAPPTQMLARGPNASANQPTSGAPTGLVPRNATTYSAMTRPRISGSVPSCTRWLAAWARKICTKPVGTRIAAVSRYVGMSPDSVPSTPKPTAAPSTSHTEGRTRRRVLASAPAAIAVVSRPNVTAPVWNTFFASTASVSW
ncbi:MAG: hypothetical protein AUG44_15865 [Actinobacteria bacterium 13_1_20CM_3_71_11]|nr:MAG: hypothetical protein AUG44_15865 [Actinobacteria bacterium 13_1_20CM_3_71_11]